LTQQDNIVVVAHNKYTQNIYKNIKNYKNIIFKKYRKYLKKEINVDAFFKYILTLL